MITLRRIEFSSQYEQDKLLEKQWAARVYFMDCPFRKAQNYKWRSFFKNKAKKL